MKRRHAMPFGAEVEENGVRFRLWAPGAQSVGLSLDGGPPQAMTTRDGGWYELFSPEAGAGSRYRFRIDGKLDVPDPASRFQPEDVHGPSMVVDPAAYDWTDEGWAGRPWEEAVIYELHVGCFTDTGSFHAVERKLDCLADLGVTAIELMPVADFPGARGWGYDGVLPFAPDSSYGRPEDLKHLVEACHARGLMVFLDVVYNHFGPEGNYLSAYAPQFFTDRHHTPWGKANNFDGPGARAVRDFFIHNALYWLEEYHLDGLRFDAVHAILDDSEPHFLKELAERVHEAIPGRPIHLVLENDANEARYLERGRDSGKPCWYTAQWDDDIHHLYHVLATGETGGYYGDYKTDLLAKLGRCLTQGFAYQGEPSEHRGGAARGELANHLPPTAFVAFLQNHDQIGNRAMGERLGHLAAPEALRALTALLLLAPMPPLLFMGDEWAAEQPFLFFCDFHDELADAVREGRRREFAAFPEFQDETARERIPDPNAPATFAASKLNWADRGVAPHKDWLAFHRELLHLRQKEIAPRLRGAPGRAADCRVVGDRALTVEWLLGDDSRLVLVANLGPDRVFLTEPEGELVYATHEDAVDELPPWSVAWYLHGGEGS